MTCISQKHKGAKSLGFIQTYELNQGTICLVRNRKSSAKIFLVHGPARAKIMFYEGKLYVIMIFAKMGLLEGFKKHLFQISMV